MSALNRFEQFMEQMVEGSVARLFRSPVQPAEIAKRLERAMESNQQIGVRRILVPGRYKCYLNPEDFAAFQPIQAEIEREMATYLNDLASERNFTMLEHPQVQLVAEAAVARRSIQVEAELGPDPNAPSPMTQVFRPTTTSRQGQQSKSAMLLLQGANGPQPLPIESTLVSLGRGLGNDVILEDTRVSRNHAQLRYKNRRFWVADLGSTNGTFVNGERISESALHDGDTISLGGLELVFKEG